MCAEGGGSAQDVDVTNAGGDVLAYNPFGLAHVVI